MRTTKITKDTKDTAAAIDASEFDALEGAKGAVPSPKVRQAQPRVYGPIYKVAYFDEAAIASALDALSIALTGKVNREAIGRRIVLTFLFEHGLVPEGLTVPYKVITPKDLGTESPVRLKGKPVGTTKEVATMVLRHDYKILAGNEGTFTFRSSGKGDAGKGTTVTLPLKTR